MTDLHDPEGGLDKISVLFFHSFQEYISCCHGCELCYGQAMTFGEHIRTWREERGIGLRWFAKAVGVSPTFVSKMERGRGPLPGEATIRKMAAFFDRNPDELLALADKVAVDVLAIIIKQPVYAGFLRANAHLTKGQWDTLANTLPPSQDKNDGS
jgi:transcriptional regulator with XRE-family HTH domain